jgi:hypothetical protein
MTGSEHRLLSTVKQATQKTYVQSEDACWILLSLLRFQKHRSTVHDQQA